MVDVFDGLYAQLIAAYLTQDGQGARNIGQAMQQLISQLDDVLSSHSLWMLGNWTTSAE
jgi:Alpha-N-acetylglucosaminidase (NAGLU) C-terminal domain